METEDQEVREFEVILQVVKGLVLAVTATLAPDARARLATALCGAAAVPSLHPVAAQQLANLAEAALSFASSLPGESSPTH
jgi:hypothetical protein